MIELTYPWKEQSHQAPKALRNFSVPGWILSVFKSTHSSISSLNQLDELSIVIVLVVQVRKLRHRKVKLLAKVTQLVTNRAVLQTQVIRNQNPRS